MNGPAGGGVDAPGGAGEAEAPHLDAAAVERLAVALLATPGVAVLGPKERARLLTGVVRSCEEYLADRAVRAGTRSGDIAARLALADARARDLAGAIEALDGVGWKLFGRAFRETGGEDPAVEAGPAEAFRSLRRVAAALASASAAARAASPLTPARARLLLASGIARAVQAAGLALSTEGDGLLERCTRAAFAAVGLDPAADMADLLSRAARVARRTVPPAPPGR
jgi:hypothetical protein